MLPVLIKTTRQMESTKNPKNHFYTPARPKVPMYLIFIVITLGVIASLLGILLIRYNQDLNEANEDIAFVEEQKTQLETELNELIIGYDSLRTENDSINQQLESEQDKIRRLLRINASNTQKINMYQKELTTLRSVMRSYIIQIDSLNTRNRELTEENIQVRQQLRKTETDVQQLSEEKEELSTKIAEAKTLTAKNLLAIGLNDRSKEKDKTDKIARLRICFTIRENNVADPGKKMVYLRIIRPDEVLLSSPDMGMFDFQSESLVYSAKRELEYDNKDIDMCIFWEKTEELIEGTYMCYLYCEGTEIGSTSLELK